MIDGDAPAASPQTRLTKAYGVRYPIAAAGMACVGSTPNAFTGAWAGREAEIPVAPADRPIIGQTNLLGEVFELRNSLISCQCQRPRAHWTKSRCWLVRASG
jgi:hypothetical protein